MTMDGGGTDQVKARLKSLLEWTQNEVRSFDGSSVDEDSAPVADDAHDCGDHHTKKITQYPTKQEVGVEEPYVRLCATLAGSVYRSTTKQEFQTKLSSNTELMKAFPDLTVRFYQTGVTLGRLNSSSKLSLNAPTLAGVLVDDETLILAYRGTVTIADMVADISLDIAHPWKHPLRGLGVQRAYYNLIKNEYLGKRNSHKKDIINYIQGRYSKVPNKAKMDGTPIRNILITGHSLGGGLAQVTHLCLTAQGGGLDDVVNGIREKQVQVKTIAFSAPMTTAPTTSINNDNKETMEFLNTTIRPHMVNICFRTDPVPRGYSNLWFILDLLDHIKSQFLAAKTAKDIAELQRLFQFFSKGLLPCTATMLAERKLDTVLEQAQQYRHVGKVLYYDTECDKPAILDDTIDGSKKFRDLKYRPTSQDDPIGDACNFHMFLVKENGLGYV